MARRCLWGNLTVLFLILRQEECNKESERAKWMRPTDWLRIAKARTCTVRRDSARTVTEVPLLLSESLSSRPAPSRTLTIAFKAVQLKVGSRLE